jgi:predicted nucleic acid-binding protein
VNALFADSVYLFALANPRDQHHARAAGFDPCGRMLVTTRYILVEVADGFSRPSDRSRAIDLIDALETNPNARIIPADEALFREGFDLFRQRPDG